jgi:aminoglycoside 6'-N-acetyltransferase
MASMNRHRSAKVIESDRVWLRPVEEADLDLLARWFGDPAFVEHWGGVPLSRREVAEKYLGRRRPRVESFVVLCEDDPMGYAQYWSESARSGGIDLVLAPEAQGQGLGPAVGRSLADYLLHELGWETVSVDPATDNVRAIAAWRKAGFEEQEIKGDNLIMVRLKGPDDGV